MTNVVYKWNRVHFERETPSDLWREVGFETRVITRQFFLAKTGEFEIEFFRGLGAKVECWEDDDGWTFFDNESPDECSKTCERFVPYEISVDGERERRSIDESDDMNNIPIVEESTEHLVVQFGTDTKADYDLIEDKWVG